MAGLPAGTVTSLFNDIEGSTKLFWIIAKFADEAAHKHHMSLPETQAVVPVLQDAAVGTPTINQLVPHFSVGRTGTSK